MFWLTPKRLLQGGHPPNTPLFKRTDMERTKRVTIRFTPDEYNSLKEKATQFDMTLSDYIRTKLLTKREKIRPSKCNKELLYHINRIGNNLNQIAKHCNISKSIDKLVLKELINIEQQLNKLLGQ